MEQNAANLRHLCVTSSGVYPYLLMAQLSHGQFLGGTTKTLE